ncbi:hypothetical protein AB0D40_05455 [Streptomyces massasporeus]|uniref:hypothetical protein n=1 Tax=Streptomyces massasporeus TaxID=67324 RepID=UPI0033D772FF
MVISAWMSRRARLWTGLVRRGLKNRDGAGDREDRGEAVHQAVRGEAGGREQEVDGEHPARAEPVREPADGHGADQTAEPGDRQGEAHALGGDAEGPGEEHGAGGEEHPEPQGLDEREDAESARVPGGRKGLPEQARSTAP